MPSLKDLRNRIASVKATQKITKAMQMVAAAKLRRAQQAAEAARPFAQRIDRVLANLAQGIGPGEGAPPLIAGTGKDDTHLLIIATSERGLCGGFNTSIVRLAREHIQSLLSQGKKVKIITVGKKGHEALRRQYGDYIIETVDLREVKTLTFDVADRLGKKLIAAFEAGEFDVATVFYAEFRSVISQLPRAQQIIPAQLPEQSEEVAADAVYTYEPNEEEILETLLPRNVSVQIFRALLENAASEQGARMSAMDNATRNAGEMIKKQTLLYNRSRQAMITKELIEIISGAEAI